MTSARSFDPLLPMAPDPKALRCTGACEVHPDICGYGFHCQEYIHDNWRDYLRSGDEKDLEKLP